MKRKVKKDFGSINWEKYIPIPICEEYPEYCDFYKKVWNIAFSHIKYYEGMLQTHYMDEACCTTQIWIWDSCFIFLFCKYGREVFPGVETLNNFYEVLYDGKHLPKVIPSADEPKWTKSTPGVPYEMKIHIADNPPLFAWAEYENALMQGNLDYVKNLLYKRRYLQKHYEWVENLHKFENLEGVLLHTSLLSEKYFKKKQIVNSLYWDDQDKFYYDIDCNNHEFYKVMTIASYWTLTSGIASEEQAGYLAARLSNSNTFGGIVPFCSLARSDNDYDSSGEYWRGSVWLPTAYAALKGLTTYELHKDAHNAAAKLLEHMYRTYSEYTPHTI